MKKIIDLTKSELLNFISNNMNNGTVDVFAETCECAACGTTDKALYYYICENCENDLKDD